MRNEINRQPLSISLILAAMLLLLMALVSASVSRSEQAENSEPSARTNNETIQDKTVRVIYLVSKDREVRADFQSAMERAIQELQKWYGRQLNGPTFKLHNPVVEVAHSSQSAGWFYSHPHGANPEDWGFNNTLAEAERLLGARFNDPHYIWVIYSDGPGNKGRGTSGVTCLPEDDLLGHELGHAFGLPHPADTTRDADAIMWAGFYGKYPDKAYLTEPDKKILLRSPFFFLTGKESRYQTRRNECVPVVVVVVIS